MRRSERAAKNVVVSVATQLLGWALTFSVTLFLPRYVGSVGLGELALAAAVVALVGVLVPLGTSNVLVKEIARDPRRAGELLGAAVLLRVPLGIGAAAVVIGLGYVMGYPAVTRALIAIAAAGMVVGSVNDAFVAALQGQERMSRAGASLLAEKFVLAAGIITLITLRAGLPMIAAAAIFAGTVGLGINAAAFRQILPTLRLPTRAALTTLVLAGMPFMGWTVFRTLYGQTDPIILNFFAPAQVIGWYAAATRIVGSTLFFPVAVTTALLPTLSALYANGARADFTQLARRLLSLILLMGIPAAVILVCLPVPLLALLHYPPSFEGTIPVLRVAGVGALLYFAAIALGTVVIAADRQVQMFRVSVLATLVGIPACVVGSWLTGHYAGNAAVGAMASDALLEALLIVAYVLVAPPGTYGAETLSRLARLLLAAVPMAVLFQSPVGRNWGLPAVLPGLILYLAGCLLLRCIDPEYGNLARRLLRRGQAVDSSPAGGP